MSSTDAYNISYRSRNRERLRLYAAVYRRENKEKVRLCSRSYRKRNKKRISRYNIQWSLKNKEKVSARQRRYRQKHPDRIKLREAQRGVRLGRKPRQKLSPEEKTARARMQAANWRQALKLEVFTHYCDGQPPKCSCGHNDLRALSIDHVNGKGTAHRKTIKGGGLGFYRWLKVNAYPTGFQVLCMNCQFVKRHESRECR